MDEYSPMETLVEAALRVIIANISSLTDIGDLPFDKHVSKILSRVNADQLLCIESNSPQIRQDDLGIWRGLCEADFGEIRRALEDGSLEKRLNVDTLDHVNWRDLYSSHRAQREQKMVVAGEKLRSAYTSLKAAKAAKTIMYSEKPFAMRPPRKLKTSLSKSARAPGGVGMMARARAEASKDAGMFRTGPAAKKRTHQPGALDAQRTLIKVAPVGSATKTPLIKTRAAPIASPVTKGEQVVCPKPDRFSFSRRPEEVEKFAADSSDAHPTGSRTMSLAESTTMPNIFLKRKTGAAMTNMRKRVP